MKISHEVSHAWFGIMIGALDWTEAWISEGFATFMEEVIHDRALAILGVVVDRELPAIRLVLTLKIGEHLSMKHCVMD